MPNLEPTRRNRVGKNCTRRRLVGVIGSDSLDHQRVAGRSVGVIDLRTRRENDKKTQIRQRNPDSGNSFPNSSDISLRSSEISLDLAKISPDLMRYRQIRSKSHWIKGKYHRNLGFFRQILENYCRNLEILAGVWKYFGQFGFFGF